MFSYYALETWLFSFFALLLLAFIIFYTKRLITILTDMRRSNKKVSYRPWKMENKLKQKPIFTIFGPIKNLVPIRESAISSKKCDKQLKSTPSTRLDAIDGIASIEATLSRSSSVASGFSCETTTTNSEFYREGRGSISEMIKDEGSWTSRLMVVDQNQNTAKNDLQSYLSAAAVENLSTNLPKVVTNRVTNVNNQTNRNSVNITRNGTLINNSKNKETFLEDDNNNDKIANGNVIYVTPEINGIPFSNIQDYYSPSNQQSFRQSNLSSTTHVDQIDDHIEVISSKTIPVIDESFTSSSTTIEGNNRSTITKTTSKKVTVTEVSSQRKLENRIKV